MQMFEGIVMQGERRGTQLGFPTINIPLSDAGVSGIYAGNVHTDVHTFQAAIFADPARKVLEAHLLDFSGDLYGSDVRIELLKKLRERRSYENDEELRAAIAADVKNVRQYFAL